MNLSEELDSIYKEAIQKIGSSISEEDLDKNKNDFIGKKGKLTAVLKNVASLSIEEKKQSDKKQTNFLKN
ncbi:aminoacyl tRNA ligase class II, N-terminal-like domain protein [Leptospira interrogans serovar Grippotyphosa str. LT2186]|uniref:Aminoacyl tRNA ligase class II, N-terminal-like domain protein n=7 Tax=Leptospira interrogans TaxID=173 RepID=M6ZQN1_LEPIR|nr:aminoacyl tRNA ligase class II, N-terminal-like domain protein [Leptospira interrogans serovar Lora str. TE 1992]EMG08017.1 aminoacyl tRNA ligase class II, N-terminal-like domain protein [Leptospira interrogans serovar Grippotyphosa str. LT2186]EMM93976.1 aminoacyl tRNA ligase class II, N-terminal-like domain protein [Leptospira interrogans serovar Zanoni str. LT2156]EMN29111.1 aminoacyl tRNA ligase class II, N-terminal-like domain protein [Leptospira interrogans serovar Pyrogenes str. L0374]